ncbi:hypothetical protein ACJ72_07487, partial [Emergomyces africanus]
LTNAPSIDPFRTHGHNRPLQPPLHVICARPTPLRHPLRPAPPPPPRHKRCLGVFGMYYSLRYLALSEATVLTFLAPIACCYVCSLTMPNETFTRRQQLAGLTSLLGVVLIARPASLFHGLSLVQVSGAGEAEAEAEAEAGATAGAADDDANYKRTLGILSALLGVVGATVAYTSIRMIGKRTHPLVSVTYFSGITTIVSVLGVLLIPTINFRFPGNMTEFLLLVGLGVCGFVLQFLLTAGLSYVPPSSSAIEDGEKEVGKDSFRNAAGVDVDMDVEVEQEGVAGEVGEVVRDDEEMGGSGSREVTKKKNIEENVKPSTHGSKATSMVYTQMLFALLYDKLVFNATPSLVSWAGSGIILASAIYVALVKESKIKDGGEGEGVGNGIHTREWTDEDALLAEPGEGRGLLADSDDDDDGDGYEGDRNGNGNRHI